MFSKKKKIIHTINIWAQTQRGKHTAQGAGSKRDTTQPRTLVQIHMASVPGSPGQLAKVLTVNSFVQWGDTEVRQGKGLILWKSVDDEERWVDLAIAMHEGSVPAKLLALYTIPKEGLTDTLCEKNRYVSNPTTQRWRPSRKSKSHSSKEQ